jgi:hypothetical protein
VAAVTVRGIGSWVAVGLLGLGVLGCLRAFGPDLRRAGVHAGLPAATAQESCMDCHESEADALARMQAADSRSAASESGPPLVADWMITDLRPCTDCHRIRE